jgi:magnesium transporter
MKTAGAATGTSDLEDAGEAAKGADGFVWLGVVEPSTREFEAIATEFDLHELAVEDAINAHQRPKVELYGDTLLVVLKTVRYAGPEEVCDVGELLVFVHPTFIITVRHGDGELSEVRRRIERRPDLLGHGAGMVLYAILDYVVDVYEEAAQVVSEERVSTSAMSATIYVGSRRGSRGSGICSAAPCTPT